MPSQVIVKEERQLNEPKPVVTVKHVWNPEDLAGRPTNWKEQVRVKPREDTDKMSVQRHDRNSRRPPGSGRAGHQRLEAPSRFAFTLPRGHPLRFRSGPGPLAPRSAALRAPPKRLRFAVQVRQTFPARYSRSTMLHERRWAR